MENVARIALWYICFGMIFSGLFAPNWSLGAAIGVGLVLAVRWRYC